MSINKILLVNIGFIPESLGGTEFYTYNLALELRKQGHDVAVLAAVNDLSLKRYKVLKSITDGIQVYKIANSHLYAKTFKDFFVDETIDKLFTQLVADIRPDLIHFQHLALLSGNLPQMTKQLGIPSVLTLHDYWTICHRSRLLRPGCDICSGPAGGLNCATCDDGVSPNPIAIPKFPSAVQFLNRPSVQNMVTKTLEFVPQEQIVKVRSTLFGNRPSSTEATESALANSQLRHNFFKQQLTHPEFLLSPSKYLKERFEKEGVENIQVLPLGFRPITPFKPLPLTGKLKVAFTGSLERHKGVTQFLNELATFDGAENKLEINIYGHPKDPIYTSEIKKLVERLPRGLVNLYGSYRSDKDLQQIFANSHLMIFPSIWEENHPLVLREALLHGRPVIASNLGGVPEIIKHGENGLLFNPFQTGDLANQLKLILDNPLQLKTLTQGAQNSIVETIEDHALKLVGLYEQAQIAKSDLAGQSSL